MSTFLLSRPSILIWNLNDVLIYTGLKESKKSFFGLLEIHMSNINMRKQLLQPRKTGLCSTVWLLSCYESLFVEIYILHTNLQFGGVQVKVRKFRKQILVYSILPKITKLIILGREDARDIEFSSFIVRIEGTINCFLDLLTFSYTNISSVVEF